MRIKPALLVVATASIVILASSLGAERPAYDRQDLASELANLKKRVAALEREKTVVQSRLETNQELLAKVFAWFRKLPDTTEALEKGMESARQNGFEAAGPNPKAKKEVLDALKGFARALDTANPAVKPSDEK